MWEGTITKGDDGHAGRRHRGDVPARRLGVEGPDGEALEVVHAAREGTTDHQFHPVRTIEPYDFDVCPICLTPAPDSLEHLPPGALGGVPMTRTCKPCNNGFGRIEAELIDWRDDALRYTSVTSDGIVGARKLPRILDRRTTAGKFVWIVDGPIHPEAEPMLRGTGFSVVLTPPAPQLYKIAALKQAYLAACLELRSIPRSPMAEVLRTELVAARDAPSRRDVRASEYVQSMPLMRTHEHPHGPAAVLGVVSGAGGQAEWWIALASTIAVPWPCPDAPPVP